jgi:hypothetical protein
MLTIAIWISASFVIAAAISGRTMTSAILTACLLPVAAVLLAAAYVEFVVAPVPGNSTAPIIIPLALLLTVLGSVPGSVAGWSLRERIRDNKKPELE